MKRIAGLAAVGGQLTTDRKDCQRIKRITRFAAVGRRRTADGKDRKNAMKLDKIEHIGIAVRDVGEASKFYQDVFGCKISDVIDVPDRKLRIAFTDISGTKLEFLMPTDPDSVMAKFLDKRGEGIHHICFEVADVEKAAEELQDKGVELVEKPRMGAEGKKIVFIKPKRTHGVLIELKEK